MTALSPLRIEAARWDAVTFARQCGKEPDPWQEEVLVGGYDRLILNCSRQSGKTTTVALKALHTALYEPGSLVLILSPTQRQSGRMMTAVRDLFDTCGQPVKPEAESALRLRFANGSEIIALPGKPATVRGYAAVRLLIVDEAGDVPDSLFHAVTPMLAVSGGSFVLLGTPRGKRGLFFERWSQESLRPEPERRWRLFEVPWWKCPRIRKDFIEDERREKPAAQFAEEYECQFLDADRAAFRYEDIQAAMRPDIETWDDLAWAQT